jgi:hypothetical protein
MLIAVDPDAIGGQKIIDDLDMSSVMRVEWVEREHYAPTEELETIRNRYYHLQEAVGHNLTRWDLDIVLADFKARIAK